MNKYKLLPLLLLSASACSAEYPAPIQTLEDQGAVIESEFTNEAGQRAYIASFGTQQVALYLTEDEEHLIVGNMLDAQGNNLTARHMTEHAPKPEFNSAWGQLEQSTWVGEGAADADRVVYVFTDPNCPFCHQFWEAARPFVGEQVQLRHILVGILKADSEGKAARILAAEDPVAALQAHEERFNQGGAEPLQNIPANVREALSANATLMAGLGSRATPTIFYRDDDNQVRRIQGMPRSEAQMREIFGD